MRRAFSLALLACGLLSADGARADGGRLSVGLALGYAAPIGSTEHGDYLRDASFGLVPFAVDGAYRLLPRLGVAVHAQYGVGIPTLCRTAGDCMASLGSDVSAVLGLRYVGPRVATAAPLMDVGLGYEWLTTRLADAGAVSTRAHRGPVLLALWLALPFRLGERWTFGPVVGASVGTFTSYSLATDARLSSGEVHGYAVHGWTSVGVRLEFTP